jgi:hypothetical protein
MDSLAMALTSERQPLAHTPGDVQISVVIGTHEAGSELEETLASIAYQQEAPLWECLIVANGRFQADATLDRRLASDPRFRLLHSQVPGLTEALRLGCGQARGRWIARIDVGDVMEPNRLQRQAAGLKTFTECVLCTTGVQICGPSWEPIWVDHADGVANAPIEAILTPAERGLAVAIPHHASVMFERHAYELAGGYRREFYFGQDWDLWYRLAQQGSFLLLDDVLTSMRLRTQGISSLHRREQVAIAQISLACHVARCSGHAEEPLLREAAQIRPSNRPQGRPLYWRRREAEGLYFIAENLRRKGDPRCRGYFLRALGKEFWIPRLWLRFLQSLTLKNKLPV